MQIGDCGSLIGLKQGGYEAADAGISWPLLSVLPAYPRCRQTWMKKFRNQGTR